MADGKVEWDLVAKADQAIRELKNLGDETANLGDAFTTLAGTAKRRLLELGTDSAIALGQQFAGDVFDTMQNLGRMEGAIERTFGPQAGAHMQEWAQGMTGLFGQSPTSITSMMSDFVNKLDLDGRNAGDLKLLKSLGEMGGVIANYYPQFDSAADVMEELTNYMATGEAGQLEDALGDLGGAALTQAERMELLTEKTQDAFAAWDEGDLSAQTASNELKAYWDEAVEKVAQAALDIGGFIDGIIQDHKDFEDWLVNNRVADVITDGLDTALYGGSFNMERFFGDAQEGATDTYNTVADEAHKAMESHNSAWAQMDSRLDAEINVDDSDVDSAIAKFTELHRLAARGRLLSELGGGYAPNDPRNPGLGEFESVGPPLQNWDPDFSSGTRINMTIQVAPTTDASEVGRRTVEAIQAYERAAGTGWRG